MQIMQVRYRSDATSRSLSCNAALAHGGLTSKFTCTCEQVHPYLQASSPVPMSKFTLSHEPIHPHPRVNSPVLAHIFTCTRESIHPHS